MLELLLGLGADIADIFVDIWVNKIVSRINARRRKK